jgi:hypothetical protein
MHTVIVPTPAALQITRTSIIETRKYFFEVDLPLEIIAVGPPDIWGFTRIRVVVQ